MTVLYYSLLSRILSDYSHAKSFFCWNKICLNYVWLHFIYVLQHPLILICSFSLVNFLANHIIANVCLPIYPCPIFIFINTCIHFLHLTKFSFNDTLIFALTDIALEGCLLWWHDIFHITETQLLFQAAMFVFVLLHWWMGIIGHNAMQMTERAHNNI
jgi:hypothetical protein